MMRQCQSALTYKKKHICDNTFVYNGVNLPIYSALSHVQIGGLFLSQSNKKSLIVSQKIACIRKYLDIFCYKY